MSGTAIIIASYGDAAWIELADRAHRSAGGQGATEIIRNHDSTGTLASVRNEAASRAMSDWLCFLDADDELAPNYLMPIAKAIGPRLLTGNAHRGLYAPSVGFVLESGDVTTPMIPNEGHWPRMNECVIGTVVHRDLFNEVGGFREYEGYEDWDLWLRCERAGAEIVYVRDAVYRAHVRPHSRNRARDLQRAYDLIWSEYEAVG